MPEYINREDVLEIINYIRTKYMSAYNRKGKCTQFWADTIRYIERKVRSLTAVDISFNQNTGNVNIVNCKDCRYYGNCSIEERLSEVQRGSDTYCSYGKRKELSK